MKIATIHKNGHTKPLISYNEIWYDLYKVHPETQGRNLLSLISDDSARDLFQDSAFETSVPHELKKKSEIPTPQRFALPYTPRQIICLGRNYAAHAKELGNEIPSSPLLFNKLPSSCIGDQDTVEIRSEYGRVDYEGEVAVVVGKPIHNISKEEVFEAIFGYTLLNDFTARDMQDKAKDKGHPWLLAKSLDTFCPIGPYITTRNDASWPLEVDIQLSVNGEIRQTGNTNQFIFDVPTAISYISSHISLFSGDIIATGTPEGVAPVHDGDLVELSARGLGTLSNPIRQSHNL